MRGGGGAQLFGLVREDLFGSRGAAVEALGETQEMLRTALVESC